MPCKVKHISPATYFFDGFGFNTRCNGRQSRHKEVFALIDSKLRFDSIFWMSTRTSLASKPDPWKTNSNTSYRFGCAFLAVLFISKMQLLTKTGLFCLAFSINAYQSKPTGNVPAYWVQCTHLPSKFTSFCFSLACYRSHDRTVGGRWDMTWLNILSRFSWYNSNQ